MPYVMVNGIRCLLAEGAKVDDYHGLVTQATAEMIQFRETWGDDEYFAIKRTGDLYTLIRTNGQDEVHMGPVPAPEPRPAGVEIIQAEPEGGYLPAFHTVDANGDWLGITICLSGKWGPPYFFYECDADAVFPFEWGLWNIDADAERPDPEIYKEHVLADEMALENDEDSLIYWEVPANHDVCARRTQRYGEDGYDNVTKSNSEPNDEGYYVTTSTYSKRIHQVNSIALIEDWEAYDADYSAWKETARNVYSVDEYWDRTGYQEVVYHVSNPTWPININDWESYWTYYGPGPADRIGTVFVWNTFAYLDEEQEDVVGASFFGVSDFEIKTSEGFVRKDGRNAFDSYEQVFANAADYVYAFNTTYLIRALEVAGNEQEFSELPMAYYSAPEAIEYAHPRIYQTARDACIFLGSIARKDHLKWEYLSIRTGENPQDAQINDPDAMFDWIDDDMHTLPIEVGGEPVFGNGHFTMVRRDLLAEHEYTEQSVSQ